MGNFQARIEINEESVKRVKKMKFGEPVTNVCAGEEYMHMYFVRHKHRSGNFNSGHFALCTDGNGRFGEYGVEVIYPGHIDREDARNLYEPIHAAWYGKP